LEEGGFTAFRDPLSYGQSPARKISRLKSNLKRKWPKIDETAPIIVLDESPNALKATDPMKAKEPLHGSRGYRWSTPFALLVAVPVGIVKFVAASVEWAVSS